MISKPASSNLLKTICFCGAIAASSSVSAATIVEMQTSLGNIDIELFDSTAPLTVANFLSYVNSGAYTDSFIHRSIPGFVIQGGGFSWDIGTETGPYTIPTQAPVLNEYAAPNVRGTIAMAKLGTDPNSATDQWFFNLVDNTSTLGPSNNGGFTVFGQVIGNGMNVVDAIAGLVVYNLSGGNPISPFANLPLLPAINTVGYVDSRSLVMVYSVQTVPLPQAGWLFATGIMALTGWAKRRKV